MSEQIGKIRAKLKAVFGELRQFEEYVRGYLEQISFEIFMVKEIQSATIEYLQEALDRPLQDGVKTLIKARQAEAQARQAAMKAELADKERIRQEAVDKIHDALGSDGQVEDSSTTNTAN
jgi:sugar-specific transcriptional regulator TrmB